MVVWNRKTADRGRGERGEGREGREEERGEGGRTKEETIVYKKMIATHRCTCRRPYS